MEDLSDFLKSKQEEYEQEQLSWSTVKEDWLQQVQDFLEQIKSWLQPLVEKELIQFNENTLTLDEEHIGSYTINILEIVIGANRIKVEPVGRLIIGALGRIDISSNKGSYIILYQEQQGWIYRNAGQREKFRPFNEASFTQMIKELA